MSATDDLIRQLPSEVWERLEPILVSFEAAWRRGDRPALKDFWNKAAHPVVLLVELVHLDLEFRLKAGQAIRVETYLEHFPELGREPQVLLGLIAAEFSLRRRQEPGLDVATYLQRFPQFQEELPDRMEAAVAASDNPAPASDRPIPAQAATPGWREESAASVALGGEKLDFLAPPLGPGALGRLGSYRVLRLLGKGGMGMVLQAEDTALKRMVALKIMRPELAADDHARQRFVREAQATAAIEHPHIVHVYQVGQDRGIPFLAMPFLKGESLDERLKREKRLPADEAVRIARQTAEGLAAAHEVGLIHRDIKPANLWLERRGETGASATGAWVKILDFGLARAADGDDVHLTNTGAILGTPAYMAPEQARGERVDARCDLFSLGAVLYCMLTGELPFKGRDTMAILMALATETPRPIHEANLGVSPRLADLVMRLLTKDPDQRPASAGSVAETLAMLEGTKNQVILANTTDQLGAPRESGFHSVTALLPGRPRSSAMRRRILLGTTLLGCLLVVGTLVLRLGSSRNTDGTPTARHVQELPRTFTNSLGMEFVLVPKGKSWLDGGGGKLGDKEVRTSNDFYLGKYEVTQEEWQKIMGSSPSSFSRAGEDKEAVKDIPHEDLKRFPVENVSWDDAQLFLAKLNAQAKQPGWLYRLPTEPEWEYACRGGPMSDRAESAFDFYLDKPSNALLPGQANIGPLKRPCKVGSYAPNRLALHDMHGNVYEWCANEQGLPNAPHRGGSWGWGAGVCRVVHRAGQANGLGFRDIGLRVARVPIGKETIVVPPPQPPEPVKPVGALPPTFKNHLGMEFVLVPKGKAWLGGGGKPGDKEVEIAQDFYLGKYEVTQEEWEKVTGINPSNFKAVAGVPPAELKRFPVERMSWQDAQLFLERLNKQEQEAGWVYRLPKEAEWEYACRNGPLSDKLDSARDFYFDKPMDQLLPEQANFENGLKRTCKVGNYKPNKLGLYDMHGNVWEWCDDELKGEDGAVRRVHRGGGWDNAAGHCRAAHRYLDFPAAQTYALGLRIARIPVGKETIVVPPPKPAEPMKPVGALPPTFKNDLGMEFVLVPKGKAWLGGGGGRPGDREEEIKVEFYLGKYEVTQGEWEAVTNNNPSHWSRAGIGKTDVANTRADELKKFPVEMVSWDDAQLFLEALNRQQRGSGWVYRLPKEVEWEYACRGGSTANPVDDTFDYYFEKPVNVLLPGQANFRHEKGLNRTCMVGTFKPNRLGLYDMHGNVWEWCVDQKKDDPAARVLRGGCWDDGGRDAGGKPARPRDDSYYCRAADRYMQATFHRSPGTGVRLARVPVSAGDK